MLFQPTLLKEKTFNLRICEMEPYPIHWHSDLEILCCSEGSLNIYVGDREYTINKDDIILVGSCEPHEVGECSEDAKVVEISIGSLFCGADTFKQIVKRRVEMPVLRGNEAASCEVKRIVSLISSEKTYKDDLEICGRIYLLLTILFNELPTTLQMSENHQKRLSTMMRIQNALDLVATHYNEQLSLDDVAAVSGYEKSAFCRMFRAATDSTFHKYLNDYRIRKAMVLMEDNHYSLAEISDMVGFPQQKNFSRLFKDTIGITPSEYRKNHLLKK